MKKISKWYQNTDANELAFNITVILALVIGYLVSKHFGQQVNKWLLNMDMLEEPWLLFGIVSSACLFIGGFINGRRKR